MRMPETQALKRNPEHIGKTIALTEQLIALETAKIETMRQLVKALRLAQVTLEVFDGPVSVKTDGRMVYSYYAGGEIPTQDTDFVVMRDGVEVARRRLFEVHTSLWPRDLLANSLRGPYRTRVKAIVDAEQVTS